MGRAWINDVRLSRLSRVSDHAAYRLSLIGHLAPSYGHVDVACVQLRITPRCPPAARIRRPFVYNVQLDRSCFLVAPLGTQMKIPGRTGPGLSRIMQFVSGRFVLKDAMSPLLHDGRTTMGVIEDSMLSPETLAALRPMPPTFRSCESSRQR